MSGFVLEINLSECLSAAVTIPSVDHPLAPGDRLGFHRHVLDYFWIAISGCRGRVHVQDGTTVEWTYQPNEIRHGRVGKGDFTVHDLENIGDHEMVFVTVEFKDSPNTPIALPSGGTRQ